MTVMLRMAPKRNGKTKIVFFTMFCIAATSIFGKGWSGETKMYGKVKDIFGKPLQGVAVTIDETESSAVTDAKGN